MAVVQNVPDVVTNPFASAQTALQFGPQTQQALRHSQYLADALRQMQESGSQNIRSGGELAAKLLANVILMRKNDSAQDALVQAMQGDRQGQISAATAGTPLEKDFQGPAAPAAAPPPQGGFLSRMAHAVFGGPLTGGQAPAAPPAAAPDAGAPAASLAAAPPPTAPSGPDPSASAPPPDDPSNPAALSLNDPKARLLAQLVWNEARGEPAEGQQAVAAVALNRARESGQPLDQVAFAPHQFSGFTPQRAVTIPDAELARILPNIAPALAGQDPTNGADHFFNPALANPSWGQGEGQMIGQHKFLALGYGGGHPQPGAPPPGGPQPSLDTVAANAPPPPPPDPNGPPVQPVTGAALGQPFSPPGQAPAAQPYQVAANGQTPPPPAGPQQQAAQPVASPPQAVAQAQAVASTIPHQLVTPEEWQHASALVRNWHTYDAGMAYLEKLKQRAASPVEDPSKPYWGPDGRAHYAPGTESTITPATLPGGYWVRSPTNELKFVSEPNLTNAPPSGYDRDPANPNRLIPQGSGSGLPVPGQPAAPGAPAPQGPVAASGKAPIPPALQKPFMDTLDAFHKAPGYTDYANSVNAANALEANLKSSLGNNTVVDQTAVDATIRAMTGLSARQGSVNAVLEHLPWSEQLKGFVAHAVGADGMNGYITPKVLQQMRTAVHAYADGHRQLAEQEYTNYNAGANRMGFDLGQQLPTVMDARPIKWLDQPAPPAPPSPAPQQPSFAQIQAEIARRKAAGTWRGH